jgi:integrase
LDRSVLVEAVFPAWLLLATGMRRGEALGLHWRDLSLDQARLSLRWFGS